MTGRGFKFPHGPGATRAAGGRRPTRDLLLRSPPRGVAAQWSSSARGRSRPARLAIRPVPLGDVPGHRVDQTSGWLRVRRPLQPPVAAVLAAIAILETDGLETVGELAHLRDCVAPVLGVD